MGKIVDFNLFSIALLSWYRQNKRDLPWRDTTDPYKIWLSEVILQQTQVKQGLPYYYSFVSEFPTITDLAKAPEDKVLRLWQGLGYYSRARNLHFTAKQVLENYNGIFPNTFNEIIKLKGIGKYTAAAIASFAFNEKVAPVDGNVIRVLARYFGIEDDVSELKTQKKLTELATQLLPEKHYSDYNQAIMEFGALQCTPKKTDCTACVFSNTCYANTHKIVDKLPFKSKKTAKTDLYFYYFLIKYNEKTHFEKRKGKGIWENLFEPYLIEKTDPQPIENIIKEFESHFKNAFKVLVVNEEKKHILSHRTILSYFIEIELFEDSTQLSFYTSQEIENLPKPILIDKYLQKNFFY